MGKALGTRQRPDQASYDAATRPGPQRISVHLARRQHPGRVPLGQILLQSGAVDAADMVRALALQARHDALLGDVLLAHGMVTQHALMAALSQQFGAAVVDTAGDGPDLRLMDLMGPHECLRLACLPWRRDGCVTVVATSRPDRFEGARPTLENALGPVEMALIPDADLHRQIAESHRSALRLWAETCVQGDESCRQWRQLHLHRWIGGGLAALALAALIAPLQVLVVLMVVAVICLTAATLLKIAAAGASLRRKFGRPEMPRGERAVIARLPVVSVMVPLYRESDTVARLINRLGRLSYPRELLDVLLVMEERDSTTAAALAARTLPAWMRVITVPDAPLRTKPRALNYALLFARGTIVGVYDAEDAPEPDQLHRVVRRFQQGDARLACVQGVLDFYNPRSNWLARCFTIEYAAWFRMILPGMEQLGLAVPLGGTTLFFRRTVLDKLGGWDAHNVTEDADLGIRLARHGYTTALLHTVTNEEANCHILPWIKQRSRWLKGYAVTYLVHMRNPRALWQQLGAWRFWGVQVLFLGTLIQFLLAPLLWSFWLAVIGLGHPLQDTLAREVFVVFAAIFLLSEVTNLTINLCALRARHHRHLRIWVPTLHLYFPLATLAAYKGLWELIRAPFYWDKTVHGRYDSHKDRIIVAH